MLVGATMDLLPRLRGAHRRVPFFDKRGKKLTFPVFVGHRLVSCAGNWGREVLSGFSYRCWRPFDVLLT